MGAGTDSACKAAVVTLKQHGYSTVRIDVGTFHTLNVTQCDICAQVDVKCENELTSLHVLPTGDRQERVALLNQPRSDADGRQ